MQRWEVNDQTRKKTLIWIKTEANTWRKNLSITKPSSLIKPKALFDNVILKQLLALLSALIFREDPDNSNELIWKSISIITGCFNASLHQQLTKLLQVKIQPTTRPFTTRYTLHVNCPQVTRSTCWTPRRFTGTWVSTGTATRASWRCAVAAVTCCRCTPPRLARKLSRWWPPIKLIGLIRMFIFFATKKFAMHSLVQQFSSSVIKTIQQPTFQN